jgi:signal transduction histidine kinase
MNTIRGRLLALLLIGLSAVLAAGGMAVYWIAEVSLVNQLDANLESRARSTASLVSREAKGLVFDPEDLWAQPLAEAQYEFRTMSGEVLHRTNGLSQASLPAVEPTGDQCAFADIRLSDDIAGRAAWLAFRPRVDSDPEDADHEVDPQEQVLASAEAAPERLIVMVAADRRSVDRSLATLLSALIVVGAVLVATVAALVTLGVRWGLGPLDRLGRQLKGVSGETIATRIAGGDAPRELTPIYHELNRMLDRVEVTLQRERSFASAAAHELRTPLAELRTTAEVAMRWPDSDRANAALQDALSIGREMERLVDSLLHISRGDSGAIGRAIETVAWAPLVRDSVQRAAEAIGEKGLHVTVNVDERATMATSREALEIIVRNLVDNAVQYTPPRGRIGVRCENFEPDSSVLVVENGPVDLHAQDVPRLFEPFWRTDGARTDRTHVGLGLTVVQRIANAIELNVEARLAGDRLQIRVSRPR